MHVQGKYRWDRRPAGDAVPGGCRDSGTLGLFTPVVPTSTYLGAHKFQSALQGVGTLDLTLLNVQFDATGPVGGSDGY